MTMKTSEKTKRLVCECVFFGPRIGESFDYAEEEVAEDRGERRKRERETLEFGDKRYLMLWWRGSLPEAEKFEK